jgi:hypothetical protein
MEEWILTSGEWIDIEQLDKCYKYYYDSVEDYAEAAKTHHIAQDNFAATTEWTGKDAVAAKYLVGQIEKDILKDILKLQNDQKEFLADYIKGFYQKVDNHPQAKISVDFLNELLAEMSTIRAAYKRIARDLEEESYDIKRRFGHYGTVTPLDFSETMGAFDKICGSGYSNGIIQDTIDAFLDYDIEAANTLDLADFEGRINYIDERIGNLKGHGDVSAIALSTSKSCIKATKQKDKMYKILQNEYSFTDEEMAYLKKDYPKHLTTLYNSRNTSTRLELRTYETIAEILLQRTENTDKLTLRKKPSHSYGRHVETENSSFASSKWWAQEKMETINPFAMKAVNGKNEVNQSVNKVLTDKDGRYWVAVGPNVMNPSHTSNEQCSYAEMNYGTQIDVMLEDECGETRYLRCVVGECKAHTYPDGIHQTGYAFPNGKDPHPQNADDSVIEFCGMAPEITEKYNIKEIIVYDEE